jgi:hypothetical protein
VAGLFWKKSTVGWWLISQTNRLFVDPLCPLVARSLRLSSNRSIGTGSLFGWYKWYKQYCSVGRSNSIVWDEISRNKPT